MPERACQFSPCRKYRYTLWREWDSDLLTGCGDDLPHAGEFVQFVGLNPSTADETDDDATVRRVVGFAKSWGYGALCMTNLFGFRTAYPMLMKKQADPVGEVNDHWLATTAEEAGLVVACWGTNGSWLGRDMAVAAMLIGNGIRMKCLGRSALGHPLHPLRLAKTTTLENYRP